MQNSDELLLHRFLEFAEKAEAFHSLFYSDFLNLSEQQILFSDKALQGVKLIGGYDLAERKIAIFGAESMEEIDFSKAFTILKIAPKQQKFADVLSHRDILGSVLALGIKREMLGDILLKENCAYLFARPKIAPYILENLERVKHTSVTVEVLSALPQFLLEEPEERILIAASDRVDALLCAAFPLSRKEAQTLILSGKVFLNGKEVTKTDATIPESTILSARGFGRFKFLRPVGSTRKGRFRFSVLFYT